MFDPEIVPRNLAGSSERIDEKALQHVKRIFDYYVQIRQFTRGGELINITEKWDRCYRVYRVIYSQNDHNYQGESQNVFPVLKRAVNVVESEASNALFGRDDYFSCEPQGRDLRNVDMSQRSYGVLKHYSDLCGWVDEYDKANKQCLIYGVTATESVISKREIKGVFRQMVEVPVTDPETGDPLIEEVPAGPPDPKTGQAPMVQQPVTRQELKIFKVDEALWEFRTECRDIYRLYIDHTLDNPEDGDLIYDDMIGAQELLIAADQNIYNRAAVMDMLEMRPSNLNSALLLVGRAWGGAPGDGKTFVDSSVVNNDQGSAKYNVKRYQGYFTPDEEQDGKPKRRSQYWIDIGEDKYVLRIQENPLIGAPKTFQMTNYDTMQGEFYTDGIIEPNIALQTQIDDKENQSLDGLSYNLNAPIEAVNATGITQSMIDSTRKKPNKVLHVKEKGSLNKLVVQIPLDHLNLELTRLNAAVDGSTGATSLAGGSPTGTQADRSGKALNLLQAQTRSQFSKYIRKFERRILEPSIQTNWNMMVQFDDSDIEIAVAGKDEQGKDTQILHTQSVAEIVGQFRVKVRAGSQYVKQKEILDGIMQFMSVTAIDDTFRRMIDRPELLKAIAKLMPYDMSSFVDPKNAINEMTTMIQQLQAALETAGVQNKTLSNEINRLTGVVKQTDRAAEAAPPVNNPQSKAAQSIAAGETA